MVHTWLVVKGRENGESFPKLNLVPFFECVKMPANEGVIVGIGICGDEGTTPVDLYNYKKKVNCAVMSVTVQSTSGWG